MSMVKADLCVRRGRRVGEGNLQAPQGGFYQTMVGFGGAGHWSQGRVTVSLSGHCRLLLEDVEREGVS
ncbi:hypothetical protein E2C01_021615 [Portunus trituberculatus]|uniref:Uncharacterized protein n=1 Tax=Portunus trituberculatus TaxID=210409 RepID=A0A5B7E325_PORTR|nr:hypothetical protein [Portunus trituberculatus]